MKFSMLPGGIELAEATWYSWNLLPKHAAECTWAEARARLELLVNGTIWPTVSNVSAFELVRGRRWNGERLTNTSKIGAFTEPAHVAPNRCNLRGVPTYYGAFNDDTAIGELQPEVLDLVYLLYSECSPDSSLNVTVLGDLDYIRRYGRSMTGLPEFVPFFRDNVLYNSHPRASVLMTIDAFFATEFQRKSTAECPDHGYVEYKVTSAISSFLLDAGIPIPCKFDGLIYPSVDHRGGTNIAMPSAAFWDHTRPKLCQLIQINRMNAYYGIYERTLISESERIDRDGTIHWPDRDIATAVKPSKPKA